MVAIYWTLLPKTSNAQRCVLNEYQICSRRIMLLCNHRFLIFEFTNFIFSIFWILSRDVYSGKSNFFSKSWAFYGKLADNIMSLDKIRGENPIKVQRGPKMETRLGLSMPKNLFVWHYWWTWIFSSIFRFNFELSSLSCGGGNCQVPVVSNGQNQSFTYFWS